MATILYPAQTKPILPPPETPENLDWIQPQQEPVPHRFAKPPIGKTDGVLEPSLLEEVTRNWWYQPQQEVVPHRRFRPPQGLAEAGVEPTLLEQVTQIYWTPPQQEPVPHRRFRPPMGRDVAGPDESTFFVALVTLDMWVWNQQEPVPHRRFRPPMGTSDSGRDPSLLENVSQVFWRQPQQEPIPHRRFRPPVGHGTSGIDDSLIVIVTVTVDMWVQPQQEPIAHRHAKPEIGRFVSGIEPSLLELPTRAYWIQPQQAPIHHLRFRQPAQPALGVDDALIGIEVITLDKWAQPQNRPVPHRKFAAPTIVSWLDIAIPFIIVTPAGGSDDEWLECFIDSQGRICCAGWTDSVAGIFRIAAGRYLQTGDLDATFGTGGLVTVAFDGVDDYAESFALQSDDKYVLGGTTLDNASGRYWFGLARLTTAGVLDATFGTGGKVKTDIGSGDAVIRTVLMQSDGKIVAVGYAGTVGAENIVLARYSSAGVLDPTYGTAGIVTTNINAVDKAYGAAIQSDDKVVIAGATGTASVIQAIVARYTTAGVLDTAAFGVPNGYTITNLSGGTQDAFFAVAVQSDGKIVCAGQDGSLSMATARYSSAGVLDVTYGTAGIFVDDWGTTDEAANHVAIQSDGKIVVAGLTKPSGASHASFARYTSTGALDTSFNATGHVTLDLAITGTNDSFFGLAIHSASGKIVGAGTKKVKASDQDYLLVRLLSNGTYDTLGTNWLGLVSGPLFVVAQQLFVIGAQQAQVFVVSAQEGQT